MAPRSGLTWNILVKGNIANQSIIRLTWPFPLPTRLPMGYDPVVGGVVERTRDST